MKGKTLTLEEFKEVFKPGDLMKFYYSDSEYDKNWIFGIIIGYRESEEKYPEGGVDFYYYRMNKSEREDLSNLRPGDIGMDEIIDPQFVESDFFLLEI